MGQDEVTPPPRRQPRRGSPVRALAALVAAALLTATSTLAAAPDAGTPAAAQTTGGEPGAIVAANGLRLLDVPVAVAPGDTAVIRFVLPGVLMDSDELIVTVHDPVTSVAEFERTITEQRFGSVLGSATYSLVDLRPNVYGEAAVQLLVDGTPGPEDAGAEDGDEDDDQDEDQDAPFTVALRRPGVYPVTIDLRTGDQLLLGRLVTHLARLPDAPLPRLPIVLGVDLHAVRSSPRAVPDLTTVDTWLAALTEHDVPATIGITPSLVGALAGDTRLSALRAIASRGQVVDGPNERVDEAELVAEGLDAELDELDDLGSRTLQSRLGVTPLPDAWVARDVLSSRRLEVLASRGTATAIVPSTVVQGQADHPATLGRARLPVGATQLNVLVSPSHLVDPLYQAVDVPLATAQLLAYWSVMALGPTRPAEVAAWFPWERAPTPEMLDGLLAGLTSSPLFQVTRLGDLPPVPDGAPTVTFVGQPEQPDVLAEPLDELRTALSMLAGFRSMVADSDVGRSYLDLRRTLLSSFSLDLGTDEQHLLWRRVQAGVRRETSVLEPPVIDSVRLAGRRGQLPLTFVNTADYPLRVEVEFISDKVTFVGLPNQRTTMQIDPGSETHEFEVEARAAGTFPLEITMSSPDGSLPLGSSRLTVRSLGAGNLGLLLAAAALVALGVWWILWVRSSRRRRLVDPGPGGADDAEWEDDVERELVAHDER
jgi:hypothetical protein